MKKLYAMEYYQTIEANSNEEAQMIFDKVAEDNNLKLLPEPLVTYQNYWANSSYNNDTDNIDIYIFNEMMNCISEINYAVSPQDMPKIFDVLEILNERPWKYICFDSPTEAQEYFNKFIEDINKKLSTKIRRIN